MTPDSIVDHLNYCSYRAQRELHGMSAASAKRLWPVTGDAMEARFQTEKIIQAAQACNDHTTAVSGDAQAEGGTTNNRGEQA